MRRGIGNLGILCGLIAMAGSVTIGAGGFGAPKNGGGGGHKDTIGHFTFRDINGNTYTQQQVTAHKATVFVFLSCQCPVSNLYTPRLVSLAAAYSTRGVPFFAVYSDRQESLPDVIAHARQHGLKFPVVHDDRNVIADHLGAKVTPEAIIVDDTGTVRYRGRIDDNAVTTRVTAHDLQEALDAVLTDQPVVHPDVPAFGCVIRRVAVPVAVLPPGVPTYAHDVAPILRARCEGCHRPGEVAPFSLQTYQQASAWANDIKRYTQNRQMPPWKPAPGYDAFTDEASRYLTEKQIATLAKWADAGAPLGDPHQVPPPRKFTQGWQLGEPDVILTPTQDYHLAADGDDVYRNFILPANFTTDRYLSAVEVRPGNHAVVHHVLIYIDGLHAADKLEGKDHDGEPGWTSFGGPGFVPTGLLGGWAPGNDPHFLPPGVGNLLPKGANLVLQVHYHKDGKPETDRTRVGLHFARGPIDKRLSGTMVLNFWFKIPQGDPHYKVEAVTPVRDDVHVLAVTPHMHWLGREMKLWATLPDGTAKPLVWIKDWDFNWQASYFLQHPLALPKGSKVHLLAYYDNSANNPRNPNRKNLRQVTWGEQTTDEMCVAFVSFTRDHEHLAHKSVPGVKKSIASGQ